MKSLIGVLLSRPNRMLQACTENMVVMLGKAGQQ